MTGNIFFCFVISTNAARRNLLIKMTKSHKIKKTRISVFQDTSANLTKANPLLIFGEWGMETDTGRLKIGDGTNQ